MSPTNFSSSTPGSRLGGNIVLPNGGLTIRDPATGAQYVQIQLLQVRTEEEKHVHLLLAKLAHLWKDLTTCQLRCCCPKMGF